MTVPRAQGVPNRAQGTLARNRAHVPPVLYRGTGHTCLTRRNTKPIHKAKGTPAPRDDAPTDSGLSDTATRTNPRDNERDDRLQPLSSRCHGLFLYALICTDATTIGLCDKRRAR